MRATEARFAGHDCIELRSSELHCYVTVDAGPRVLGLQQGSGPQMFFLAPEGTDLSSFRSIGGHRLWVAPEGDRTYFPDNRRVEWQQTSDGICFTPPPEQDRNGSCIQKQLSIGASDSGLTLRHSLRNCGNTSTQLACWAITMMAPGGAAIMPLPEKAPHDMDHLLPVSQFALWSYTDFSDARWRFFRDHLRLRHDASPNGAFAMQKTGIFHPYGWIAYLLDGHLFLKTISPAEATDPYPDRGCNVECFTNPEFLEIETLSPLRILRPGQTAEHVESWSILTVESDAADATLCEVIRGRVELMRQDMPTHALQP